MAETPELVFGVDPTGPFLLSSRRRRYKVALPTEGVAYSTGIKGRRWERLKRSQARRRGTCSPVSIGAH
jgi:hypothetical protein